MKTLQGLNFIDLNGINHGTIEHVIPDDNNETFLVCFKSAFSEYKKYRLTKQQFERFLSNAFIKDERYKIITQKDIRHIYHFSPIRNTENILNYGLCSREWAEIMNIPIQTTDQIRLDGELNKISASISYPNYRMRYKLEKQDGLDLVIYDINPRLLLSKLDTQFYYTNASNAVFNNIDKNSLTTNDALLLMFYLDGRQPGLHNRYTTDPQAEILVDTYIPTDFIDGVIYNNTNNAIKELCSQKSKKFNIDSSLYFPRSDWRRWQNGN